MKSTQEAIITKVYQAILELKGGSINTISEKSGISWHATNRALRIMEILTIVKEEKEKSHEQQRFYKLRSK